ncbi:MULTISPECIES: hypothetical protein [unclassified Microcoleus]|uniref:hypothetical protein n=1 Tax=unclassified Microcoleus TaxID=2642155 RepID=UPI002FD1E2BE
MCAVKYEHLLATVRKIQTLDRPFCSPAAQSQARVIPLFYDSTVQIPSPPALEACFGQPGGDHARSATKAWYNQQTVFD